MNFDLFLYLTSLAFIFIYGRLAIHFAPKIFCYFLNEPIDWQKQLEKPRIFLHLIGLGFMHLIVYSNSSLENTGLLIRLISWLTFILGFLTCQFTWTKKFEDTFAPQLTRSTAKASENFNLSISDLQLRQLYNELVRFDLLNHDLTSLEDFRNVLLKDWNEHDSRLHLKMDGPSCREFYDYLTRTYPKNNMTLKNLFITSRLVLRLDGKTYNYNTLKNAPTRTAVSKHNKTLVKIFEKLS
jgi:hypothetical protein